MEMLWEATGHDPECFDDTPLMSPRPSKSRRPLEESPREIRICRQSRWLRKAICDTRCARASPLWVPLVAIGAVFGVLATRASDNSFAVRRKGSLAHDIQEHSLSLLASSPGGLAAADDEAVALAVQSELTRRGTDAREADDGVSDDVAVHGANASERVAAAQKAAELAALSSSSVSPPPAPPTGASDLMRVASDGLRAVEVQTQTGLQRVEQGLSSMATQAGRLASGVHLPSIYRDSQDATPHLPSMYRNSQDAAATPAAPSSVPVQGCHGGEDNTFFAGNDLRAIDDIDSADSCCSACAQEIDCVAWSWAKPSVHMEGSGVCHLKGAHPKKVLTKIRESGFVSAISSQAPLSVHAMMPRRGLSLFCFSLVVPWNSEPDLIRAQFQDRASIFACDEYAAFSSKVMEVAPGVKTLAVDSDLHCEVGGEFKTALNTPIFFAVWDRVVKDARYLRHDWTVKVDPDAVFFPSRLRSQLAGMREAPDGVYLNNCKRGLHGPIEVFSRHAVNSWISGRSRCSAHFAKLCSGDCWWGEDMFIDQCLWKVLQVRRKFAPLLLVEDHCDPPLGWEKCDDGLVASLHPFKDVAEYRRCMRNSEAAASNAAHSAEW